MARFYFDFREGDRLTRDDEGMEFPDLDIAEWEAAKAVAAIGCDVLPLGETREIAVEVLDEHRQVAAVVTISMDLKRVSSSSPP